MKEYIGKKESRERGYNIKKVLENEVKNYSNIFIVGHNRPDFDSIGAATGILSIIRQLGYNGYIIIGEKYNELDNDIRKIIYDKQNKVNFINDYKFKQLKDDNSLLIMVDVNKKNRIHVNLDDFKEVIIIDHHDEKENETAERGIHLIYPTVSSASELVTEALIALEEENEDIFDISETTATLLYAGIELDTNRFKARTSNITHLVADKLLEYGADKEYINNLFRNDRATYNTVGNLIINGSLIKQYSESFKQLGICFTLNRENPKYIYKQEELAKASDVQVGFKDTDAAFTLGYINDDMVSISARSSTQSINVGKIMESIDGGGNATSAGTQIITDNIFDLEQILMEKVEESLSLQETQVIELKPDLETEDRKFKRLSKKRKSH